MVRIYAFADEASAHLDGQIAAMLRNDLQGLEVRGVDGQSVSEISLQKAREVRARLADSGLETWSVGSPIGKIDIVKDNFAAHMDALRHTLDVARELGAGNMRMFSFYIPKGEAPATYRDEVMERLARMVEAAKGSGVKLCHENEKGIYGDNAARCAEILDCVPELDGVFDPANFVQCGQDTAEAWAMLKGRTRYLHIKDALADGSVVPAGKGVGHVAQIVADYVKNGGEAMTLEPHLVVFSGLDALERDGRRRGTLCYPSSDAAFDAAAKALREVLEGVEPR